MPTEPTVYVVDDDPDLCEALRWLIEADELAVETFTSAQDFLDAYDPGRPGCVVLDVRMRGMSGLDLQKYLSTQDFSLPIIILTGHGDVPMAVRAMKTGAVDFLQKPVSDKVLLDRIYDAIEQDAQNRRRLGQQGRFVECLARLTRRERQVMDLVVAGKPNKWIARELDVTERTIEVHRKHVMKKMQVGSAVELVRLVLSTAGHQRAR